MAFVGSNVENEGDLPTSYNSGPALKIIHRRKSPRDLLRERGLLINQFRFGRRRGRHSAVQKYPRENSSAKFNSACNDLAKSREAPRF